MFMAYVISHWDITTHLHSVSKAPNVIVLVGVWLYVHVPGTGHKSVPVHGMPDMSLGHIETLTFWFKKCPVCHGAWRETDYISMSPEHELVPVHGMGDMSMVQSDTFTFCIKSSRMSWRLDGDWKEFHVPGTYINSSSWYAWYVPGAYQHIYILYQNPP